MAHRHASAASHTWTNDWQLQQTLFLLSSVHCASQATAAHLIHCINKQIVPFSRHCSQSILSAQSQDSAQQNACLQLPMTMWGSHCKIFTSRCGTMSRSGSSGSQCGLALERVSVNNAIMWWNYFDSTLLMVELTSTPVDTGRSHLVP